MGLLPVCDAIWHDAARDRDIPLRIRLPAGAGKVPLVLFSPGLGGDVEGGTVWTREWVRGGVAVIHLQHRGSDRLVYTGAGSAEELRQRLRAAASPAQLVARVGDVRFVLDKALQGGREGDCDLSRLDRRRIGVGGHSMGAWTAAAVAGQRYPGGASLAEPRVTAAIGLSPTASGTLPLETAFGGIAIPFLSVTGSADGMPPTAPPEQRAAALAARTGPFRGMAPGGKYLLVFDGGDHMVFAGNGRRPECGNDAHIKAVTARATTAFWRWTLLGDSAAGDYLAKRLKAELSAGDMLEAK